MTAAPGLRQFVVSASSAVIETVEP